MAERGPRREEDYDFDEEAIPDQKLMFKAFRGEYQKLKRQVDEMDMPRILRKLDELDLKIDAISDGSKRASTRNHHSSGSNRESHDEDSEDENSAKSRRHRDREHVDSNINAIKMQIPPFRGRIDAETYLEWERKVELIFACHNYSEEKKVRLAAVEFSDYALIWWDETMKSRRRNGERPIRTWEAMKQVMRKRFVPSYYYRELHQRLHRLYQGSKSVEEYHKEMEMLMIKANIEEDPEVTMARFLGGLNREIADAVELHHYVEMEELVNMAMKVERQQRIRAAKASSNSNSKWSSKGAKFEDKKKIKISDLKEKSMDPHKKKNSSNSASSNSSSRHRDITCFKCQGLGHYASECPNKRVMVIRGNEVFSESENEGSDGCEDMPPLEDCSDHEDEVEYAVRGEALVARQVLNLQPKGDVLEQRENIFHTRCLIRRKMCNLIIDGGSYTNVASTTLVEKLGLACTKHPNPYKLQWLNDGGELKVVKQVLVTFSIGRYNDEVLCDVVPMQASHLLLGRPWQYDRRVDMMASRIDILLNTMVVRSSLHHYHLKRCIWSK